MVFLGRLETQVIRNWLSQFFIIRQKWIYQFFSEVLEPLYVLGNIQAHCSLPKFSIYMALVW